MTVRIINGSLEDDTETSEVIIRGVLDQSTLKYINMGWYQREQGFSGKHINAIIAGYFKGRIADITIGMRGQRCDIKDTTFILKDKCYCIDGGQRLYAAGVALKERPDLKISLGAKVFLGTTEDIENEMFCRLGTTQVRIAPSVLLRNRKKKSPAIGVLLNLTTSTEFVLANRIAWDQTKTRHELISGYSLARVVGALHAHKGGALKSNAVYELADGLDILVLTIGEDNFRTNIIRFFAAIDKCWNISNLNGGRDELRPHLRQEFLLTVCTLLSRYNDFWEGTERNEFYFPEKYLKRLKGFKLADYLRSKTPKDALIEILRQRLHLQPIFQNVDEAAE